MDDQFSARNILIFSIIGAIVVLVQFFYARINTNDIFVMCDIGQGDGMYLRINKIDIVIDAGKDEKGSQCLGRHMSLFDKTIDLAFITNSDLDHYGGFRSLLQHYRINQLLVPSVADADTSYFRLINEFKKRKTEIDFVYQNDVINIGQVGSIKMIWPTKRQIDFDTNLCQLKRYRKYTEDFKVICTGVNKYSQVFWLELKQGISFLFTGDITSDELDNYIVKMVKAHKTNMKFVILKVPHHGSKNGLTPKLVEFLKPDIALISAGRRNSYGHPHKETLDILREHSVPYFLTSKDKDIVIDLNRFFLTTSRQSLHLQ